MINKIIEISGVGRFQNYRLAGGDMMFKKSTIVYAENGHGKTTLSNIIRSLSSGNDSLITNRQSVGLTGQSVKIDVGGSIHSFRNGQWQCGGLGNRIEVFDSFFINENIYSGFEFSFEHSKNLHKFVLGEEGVRLSKEIEDVKNEVARQNKVLSGIEASLQSCLGREPVRNFLQLKDDANIGSKVAEATRILEIAKRAKEISEKPNLGYLHAIDIETFLLDIGKSLETSLDSISTNYIISFENHKERLEASGMVNAEDWLYDGLKALKSDVTPNKNCVFCTQPINDDIEILKAYTQYFNDEYSLLQRNLESQAKWLGTTNYDAITRQNELTYATNGGLCEYWSGHSSVTLPHTKVDFCNSQVSQALEAIKNKVDRKLLNLLEKQSTSNIDDLIILLASINKQVADYNAEVEVLNELIHNVKSHDVSVVTASGRLAYLLLVQRRYGELKPGCDDHEAMCTAIKESNIEKDTLQKALKTYSKDFMVKYGENINRYLRIFFSGGHYQLSNIDSTYSGSSKDPSAEFTLNLMGHPISFANKPGLPQGRYTLSEGDKSSIAFAFFLAKLDLEDISDKVIVFDDPVTSLDQNRRRRTIEEIISVLSKAKQVIVLSHSTTFVYDIYERCSDPKVLKIGYGGVLENYSGIVDEMQSGYTKQLRILEAFEAAPTETERSKAKGAIRLVLEDNLKFRFQRHLSKAHDNGAGKSLGPIKKGDGLGKIIDILEVSSRAFRGEKVAVIRKLRQHNVLSSPEHHGSQERSHRNEEISVDELVGYVHETLKMIDEEI